MNIYHSVFRIKPKEGSHLSSKTEKGYAFVFIQAFSVQGAINEASYIVTQDGWDIVTVVLEASLSLREDFVDIEENSIIAKEVLKCYDKAEREGHASFYNLVALDGKTEGYLEVIPKNKSHISKIYNSLDLHKKSGHCLHFDSGTRCNELIKAHSIQNSGQLKQISVDNHVYSVGSQRGQKSFHTKISTRQMSTFKGFCKYHDNLVFEAIDNLELQPTNEQVFLYAYRSLCKEIIVKENTISALSEIIKNTPQKLELLEGTLEGNERGLKDLLYHKQKFDSDLINDNYKRIQYVLFVSNQTQNCAFSGLKYPEYDFFESALQDLSNNSKNLKLITFCSAPMSNGWGYLFAWHKSSAKICQKFMTSLFRRVKKGDALENYLFRLTQQSENKAFSPIWWENLDDNKKNEINLFIQEYIDSFEPISKEQLTSGLENITDWNFEKVISNYRTASI